MYFGAKGDMLRLEQWKDVLRNDEGFVTGVKMALLSLNFKENRIKIAEDLGDKIVLIGLFFIDWLVGKTSSENFTS